MHTERSIECPADEEVYYWWHPYTNSSHKGTIIDEAALTVLPTTCPPGSTQCRFPLRKIMSGADSFILNAGCTLKTNGTYCRLHYLLDTCVSI